MKIKDLLDVIDFSMYDYDIRMSCFEYEYAKENTIMSQFGSLYKDGYAICFEIDWSKRASVTVKEMLDKQYNPDYDLISWDEDDGNIIDFEHIIVDRHNGLIVLA